MSPEVIQLATVADEEASRVLTISRSTLSFFRQSSEPEHVDLVTAAESVRLVLEPILEKQKIELRIVSEGETVIQALAGETRQVLLNLVRNAIEASSPSSEVTVYLTRKAQEVEIVVADQGSGIPGEVLAGLFQFGKSTKGDRGNGMGLWTVKHILDRHHASVEVQSTEGGGTTFTIGWPVHYAAHSQPGAGRARLTPCRTTFITRLPRPRPLVILSKAKDPCIGPSCRTTFTTRLPPPKTFRHPEQSEGPLYWSFLPHHLPHFACPRPRPFVILSKAKDPCIGPSCRTTFTIPLAPAQDLSSS